MQTLDLYKNRHYSLLKLSDGIQYKMPNEYTVEEVERLIELKVKQEYLEKQEVNESIVVLQKMEFFRNIFDQLEIIFQHYQPDITSEYLKKILTENEALDVIGFFVKYRQTYFKTDSKKKV